MLFGRLFVVLGLVAFSAVAAAAVDDNNSKQLEALMPLLAAQLGQVTGGGATPLNARYFLRGLEKLQMMQCTACAAGQVEQQPCSISADRVCGAATGAVSLTTSAGTFDAFVKVDSVGRKWVKAIQFPADYVPNTGTFGPIGKEAITEKAKLSDAQINSLSTTGTRVYRVDVDATWKESSWTNQFLYVSTDRPHVDTSASFGAVGGATRAKLGAENLDVGDVSSWSTFTQTWWDNLYSSPQIATEGCSRLFIGHGHFDCYSEGGVRCIKGGGSCKSGGYPKIPNVVIWVLYK